jgi:hypothetical protein
MKKRYKIGDKVKLSPDSEYYGGDVQGGDTIGEIVDFEYELLTDDDDIDQEEHYYKVKWGNGDVNNYRYTDLMPVEETIKKENTLKQQAVERFGFISKDDKFTIFDENCDKTIKEENPDNWTICNNDLYLANFGNGGLCIYKDGIWSERASLPKNWTVKCKRNGENQHELVEWRKKASDYKFEWSGQGWLDETGYCYWSDDPLKNKGIITYEQFLKWVYNPWKALQSSDESIKPGDWVIGWDHSKNELYHTPWQVEKIERVYAYPVGHRDWNCDISHLRKVPAPQKLPSIEKEWKPKFKIGDRVQVVAETAGWGRVEYGDIGVVTHIPERKDRCYMVDFYSQSCWSGREECFILEKAAPKFKAGDKVRAIDESHDWGCVDKGDIGTVVKKSIFTGEEDVYFVDFGEHKATYWKGHESCFELVEENVQTEFVFPPPKLSSIGEMLNPNDSGYKLQLGDTPLVRVITTNGISSEFKNEKSINLLIHKPKKVKRLKL